MSGWGQSKGAAVRGRSNNRNWKPGAFSALPPKPPPPPDPDYELEDMYSFVKRWFEFEDEATYAGEYKSKKWEDFANYGEVDLSGVTS